MAVDLANARAMASNHALSSLHCSSLHIRIYTDLTIYSGCFSFITHEIIRPTRCTPATCSQFELRCMR